MNIELRYCPRCQQCQKALREVAIWHDPRDPLLAPHVEVMARCWHCGQELYRHRHVERIIKEDREWLPPDARP